MAGFILPVSVQCMQQWAEVCCGITGINLFQIALVGTDGRQRKRRMKAAVEGITVYISITE